MVPYGLQLAQELHAKVASVHTKTILLAASALFDFYMSLSMENISLLLDLNSQL